ncbi:MAG: hypothetical protein V4488_00675 [Pseudomonadota bacterium]
MKTSKSTSLAFVIAFHVLVLCAWPRLLKHTSSPQAWPATSLFVQLPLFGGRESTPPEPSPAAATDAVKWTAQKHRPLAESIAPSQTMPAALPEAAVADQNGQAEPSAANSNDASLTQSALSSILQIDRDARKNARKLLEIAPKSLESRLAAAIAKSAGPNSLTMEEKIMADGSRVTRVSGPSGSYCVFEGGSSRTDGRDTMQSGVQKKTMSCGNLFN